MDRLNATVSYVSGLTINMDACDMNGFILGLATNVILACENLDCQLDSRLGNITVTKSKFETVERLIDEYTDGVHGAILMNSIGVQVDVLKSFMDSCVLNQSVRGLYLMCKKNNAPLSKQKYYLFELIPKAVDTFQKILIKQCELVEKTPGKQTRELNEYNEAFLKLCFEQMA